MRTSGAGEGGRRGVREGRGIGALNTLQTPQTREARSEARTEGRSAGECVILGWAARGVRGGRGHALEPSKHFLNTSTKTRRWAGWRGGGGWGVGGWREEGRGEADEAAGGGAQSGEWRRRGGGRSEWVARRVCGHAVVPAEQLSKHLKKHEGALKGVRRVPL